MPVYSILEIPPIRQYLNRIGAIPSSLWRAKVLLKSDGYEKDMVVVSLSRDGSVRVTSKAINLADNPQYQPTDIERAEIRAAILDADLPSSIVVEGAIPLELKKKPPEKIFVFKNGEGHILMVVERIDEKDGGKRYHTHSPWSDGHWRIAEPEGLLPLFNFEFVKSGSSVMIHEGPKSARAAQKIAAMPNHPWYDTMKNYVHVGWHGGAGRPQATDWGLLKNIENVVICPDNDRPGRAAVPKISELMPIETKVMSIEWEADFPNAWDMAEDLPPSFLKKPKSLWSNFRLATFATQIVGYKDPVKQIGPIHKTRETFRNLWYYVSKTDEFIRFPTTHDAPVIHAAEEFDNHYRMWSHVKKTSELMREDCLAYQRGIYIPGKPTGPFCDGSEVQNINIYVGSRIKPKEGDVAPFMEFLGKLIKNTSELNHLKDWLATVIAKPGERPGHAVLLTSAGGTGKTSLFDFIAPTIGDHNTFVLNAETFEKSPFSEHLENKVLISIPEIYAGHSWHVGNKIKSMITDKILEIHPKGKKAYNVKNNLWFLAFSNDPQPIKLDSDDRRWFVPDVSDFRMSREDMQPYYDWAESGGYEALLFWALNYEIISGREYLLPGTNAPKSSRKDQMIEMSESDDICRAIEIVKQEKEKFEEKGQEPNFTFSITRLRDLAQEGIPENKKLSKNIFSSRFLQSRMANQYATVKIGRGSAIRMYYVGKKPESIDEAKLRLVNLDGYQEF